jgi:hypothetical protein
MAYTYLIGWTAHNKWYYGVRFAKGCNPDDLWVKYFTSSKKVKEFRNVYGNPDVIQVRRTFDDANTARLWESRVIRKTNAVRDNRWMNMTDNTDLFFFEGKREPFSDEHRAKLSAAASKRKLTDAHKAALNQGRRNSKNSAEHAAALVASRLGTKHTNESRQAMSEKRSQNPDKYKIASIGGKASAEKRKDDDTYKLARRQQMIDLWAKRKAGLAPMPSQGA